MIYESVSREDSIRQGDIFHKLPFIRFDLEKLDFYLDEGYIKHAPWEERSPDDEWIMVNIEEKFAIVLSQDCDCLRSPYISLIVICPWNRNITSPKSWMENIISLNNNQHSSMYLPIDEHFNIRERMLIDFSIIFHLGRKNLESLRNLRICRLNQEAMEHFREKTAYYFHRYSYLEYYSLNVQEMEQYELKHPNEKYERREYQKSHQTQQSE